ncbi:MAG: LacI family transcriptional regulator [Firmicutes bacterium]|nr:LacI family transcriptional regulator [Bacillota bacterium]
MALRAKVSPATVSRLINGSAGVGSEREGAVRAAMEALGYVPSRLAQNFARGASRTVIIPVEGDQQALSNNPFLMALVLGLNDVLADRDYSVRIMHGPYRGDGVPITTAKWSTEAWQRREFDAMVVVNPTADNSLIEAIVQIGVPAVVIGRCPDVPGVFQVDVDNIGGARQATTHLTDLGHRNIAFLGPPLALTAAFDRQRGYLEGLARIGINPAKDWVIETSGTKWNALSFEAAYHAVKEAVSVLPVWSGLVAFNDEMALGAIRAMLERGLKVPDDVSVVGFDDLPMARMVNPALSTVHQDIRQLGQHAGRTLLSVLQGRATASLTIQTVSFVARASAVKARDQNLQSKGALRDGFDNSSA